MTTLFKLGMIDERRAVVQNPAIINEIHLAGLQAELDSELGALQNLVEHVERPPLVGGQRLIHLVVASLDPIAQIPQYRLRSVPRNHRPQDR